MDDFSQKVIEKIEQEHVHPTPRWAVVAYKGAVWVLVGICFFCAALFCALLALAVRHLDVDVMRGAPPGRAMIVLMQSVPVVWIIFFVALCVLVVLMLRQQTHAYRYRLVGVAGMVGVSVLFLAMGLHFLRLPDRAERYAERGVPPLARPWLMRGHPRLRPEDGVLIGRLTEIQPDHFVVERPPHEIWKVRIDPVRFQYRRFQVHDDIVARGHVIKPWVFQAEGIRPHRRRPFMERLPEHP